MKLLIALLLSCSLGTAVAWGASSDVSKPFLELAEELTRDLPSKGPKVAVLDFGEEGLSETLKGLGRSLPPILASELTRTKRVQVLERSDLEKILKELKLTVSGVVEPKEAAQLGRVLGAKYVVLGSLLELKTGVAATVRLVEVETSVTLSAATRTLPRELVHKVPGFIVTSHGLLGAGQHQDWMKKQAAVGRRIRAAIERLKRDPLYEYVELDDLAVDPASYYNKRVSMVGVVTFVNTDGRMRTMRLGTGFGTGTLVWIRIANLAKDRKKPLLKLSWPPHAIALKGQFKEGLLEGVRDQVEPYYAEAHAYEELGECSGSSIADLLKLKD